MNIAPICERLGISLNDVTDDNATDLILAGIDSLVMAGDWDEDQHSRDEKGRFASKEAGAASSAAEKHTARLPKELRKQAADAIKTGKSARDMDSHDDARMAHLDVGEAIEAHAKRLEKSGDKTRASVLREAAQAHFDASNKHSNASIVHEKREHPERYAESSEGRAANEKYAQDATNKAAKDGSSHNHMSAVREHLDAAHAYEAHGDHEQAEKHVQAAAKHLMMGNLAANREESQGGHGHRLTISGRDQALMQKYSSESRWVKNKAKVKVKNWMNQSLWKNQKLSLSQDDDNLDDDTTMILSQDADRRRELYEEQAAKARMQR